MERGDCKSIIRSNSIVFIWMDNKQVSLTSNYHGDNEVVPISRRLKDGQRITIDCPKNASICNSFICYNQLAQDKLTYLNYMVSVAKSLCSGSERVSRGRPPSENKPSLTLSKTALNFVNEMHLSAKGNRRRCAYGSTKETDIRSTVECFSCKLSFCLKDGKNCFFDYHTIFE